MGTGRGRYKKQDNNPLFVNRKLSILLTNFQTAKSRQSSLQATANSLDIDIVLANETNLKKDDKFQLEGFLCFSRNRKNSNFGRSATCIRDKYSIETLKVSEGNNDEYLITRHGQFKPAINIINLYGKQESRQTS